VAHSTPPIRLGQISFEQIGHLVGRPGLGAFLAAGGDRAALGAWLAEHAGDPLAETALARLRQAR
jgi:hypothetical protein